MSQYQKLLEELDTMAKSLPADGDDEKIATAAGEGNPDADGDGKNDVTDEGGDATGGEGGDDGDDVMGKSFALTLDDGTELEAVDGTELVKSLISRVETNETTVLKALESAVGLIGKQGSLIKSLQDQVKALAGQGRGRRTVVSVSEKPQAGVMAKSEQSGDGISGGEFMVKALAAQAEGRLTGLDVARAESALNRGTPVPQDIVNRVISK